MRNLKRTMYYYYREYIYEWIELAVIYILFAIMWPMILALYFTSGVRLSDKDFKGNWEQDMIYFWRNNDKN